LFDDQPTPRYVESVGIPMQSVLSQLVLTTTHVKQKKVSNKCYTRVYPKLSGLSVDNEINNNKHWLRSNTKVYGG